MIRTVGAPADHVVVVGAGLSGLSAALHLAGRGRSVTVVERHPFPGGRMGQADIAGYRIDTGPTVLTMPDIISEAFAAVGASMADHLDLMPVEPAYRATFADGSALNVHPDAAAMADRDRRLRRSRAGRGLSAAARLAHRALPHGIRRLHRRQLRLAAVAADAAAGPAGRHRRLPAVGADGQRFITDERLRRVFTFQSLYAGVPPQRALAVYAVIAYMDTVAGVYFPRGGMRAVPDAIAAVASTPG